MDTPSLASLAPFLTERAGIAALGALAIWAGVRTVTVVIQALRDVEMRRTDVQMAMAEALRAQAQGAATLAQMQAEAGRQATEQTIVLRLIAGRVGLVPPGLAAGGDDGAA